MATTIIKKYSNAPYYDDFDETKNFHRILFRPGFSVQARELTQIQTLLQAQIDRFGQYNFKDGSRVVNGKATLNVEYDFVKIESAFTHSVGGSLNTDTYLNSLVGTTITGATSGVKAKVLQVVAAEGSDPNTLYVKYIDSGTNNTGQVFTGGEELSNDSSPTLYAQVKPTSDVPTGQGSSVNIEEGVYFITGNFVFVPAGTLILDKYTNTPNYIVGLKVTEEIIDSSTDTSLLDNAQGVPNTSAPGATRYKIRTELVKSPLALGSRTEASFITLLVVTDGKTAVDKTDKTLGTELDDRLARRTFEESGDYTVEPFVVNVKEYFNDGSNNGFKTAAQIITDGDASNTLDAETFGKARLIVAIEPGVAYVKGYRIQNFSTKQVIVEKPRGSDATNAENGAQKTLNVGNYVKVKEASMQGVPDVNDFTTVTLYTNTIAQGQSSNVGTARVRNILDDAAAGVKRLYLFDIEMSSGSFSSVKSVKQTVAIPGETQFRADIEGTAQLFDVGNNGLVFKLPYNAVKSTRSIGNSAQSDIVYEVKQKFIADGSSGTATITLAVGSGAFTDFNNAFVYANVGGTPQTVQIGSNTNYYSLIDNNRTVQLNVSTIFGGNSSDVQLIATVQKSGILEKTKSVNGGAASGTVNVTGSLTNGVLSLGKADIKKVISITDSNGTDILSRFTVDNGQRDNFYDVGRVILKSGFTVSGNITVTFDYYSHGTGDYFTVDSYPQEDYDTIYSFSSIQGVVNLRDCIDFRPRKDDTGANFDGTGSSSPQAPATGQVLATDIEYYMPRIDKLIITRRGEYTTEVGVPDENPKAPKTPDDAMGIYNLRLSPYVFSTSGVKPQLLDNRRYTMRDIGDLDKRIKNLEYYTSLSLLEQSAADVELFDGSGFSRLKNGFIVDGFHGHNVGDPANPDYSASIDKRAGELRPKFDERNVNLIRKAGDVGAGSSIVNNAGIVTLPFTETNYINQPYASTSINVNPYNVFSWGGTVELSPDSDEWKDVDVRPTVTINDSSSYDQFAAMAEETGILGTVWNEWETNWTGVDVDVQSDTNFSGRQRGRRDFWWDVNEFGDRDAFNFGFGGGRQQVTTTTTTTTTQNQSRSGLRTDIAFDTVTKSNGKKVVEVNFVPFIRSRKVFFKAQLLKPNTRVYAFFDGVDVSSFVREESFTEFSGRSDVRTYENQTSHPDGSSNLISDSSGTIEGSFVIPRNQALKFATGTREFRLSDSSANDKTAETTFAEAAYHAQGLKESIEETVISTKVPRLVQSELNQNRTLVDSNVSETTTWIDPVAETILIDQEGGLFVKSTDIYFKTKDANIPVRLTIRTTENGIPTQKIVPGADKILYPSSVNISNDSTAATNFAFDFPVYLAQDQEYAIVLTSQSDGYEVFIAEMGGFDLANTAFRIIKQPFGGVFFTSQNASTWTPEQSKDLKFKLNRCNFTTNGSTAARSINFANDTVPARSLIDNPFTTTSGSGVITVTHKNHGMHDSTSRVTIAGASATNGIAANNINGTHTIGNITHDSYTITATSSDTASATGAGGGTNVTATENRHIDVMYPVVSEVQVPGTSATYFATMRTSQSIDGSETAYQVGDEFQILPNKNYQFSAPRMIGSQTNETAHMGGNKSFNLKATLSSTSNFLSPVIDMTNLSLHTIQNIIGSTNSATTGEEVTRGGTELARYITRKVELNEEADIATVYLNVNRPGSSNVYLYYRALPGGSGLNIEDVAFDRVTPNEGDIPVNERDFEEVRYDIDPAGTFGTIQFKVVLVSTNSSTPPKVKDLRAICAT